MVKKTYLLSTACVLFSLFIAPSFVQADENKNKKSHSSESSFSDALSKGKVFGSLRYRYEYINNDKFTKKAKASTLRTRIGYETAEFYGLKGLVEFEDVTSIGSEKFNDGGVNGLTQYPVVADASSTEVNRAFLTYSYIPNTTLTLGRQAINRNNVRFIGDVRWRQNDQTFDAFTLTNKAISNLELFYAYVNNVERLFGEHNTAKSHFDSNIHLFDAKYSNLPMNSTLFGYTYFLDLGDKDDGNNNYKMSSKTYGFNLSGYSDKKDNISFIYDIEYARQSDYADNPTSYNANYYRLEPGIKFDNSIAKIGYEVLGADRDASKSFSTPLATLHKFNGWSDKFLSTPVKGLEDIYGKFIYKVKSSNSLLHGLKFIAAYHNYNSKLDDEDYGKELNLKLVKKFSKYYLVGVKYGKFSAGDKNTAYNKDSQKWALWAMMKF